MLNLNNFENKIYSQHGEDGITIKLVETIYENPFEKHFVEFGVDNGLECNARILREKFNWSGLMMDGGFENTHLNLKREFVTKENVLDLFRKYNVPHHINFLSIDIDYNDFYCAKEILKEHICDILVFEYNGTHLPTEDKIIIYNKFSGWDGYNYFGASLLSWKKLANLYDYSLVCCDSSGTNCYFVNNKIIKERNLQFLNLDDINSLYRPPIYGDGPNGGHRDDTFKRTYLNFETAILR